MRKTECNIRKSHKFYKKELEGKVDVKKYIEIANTYNEFLIEKILEGEEVTLPFNMGVMSIVGYKPKITFDENNKPNLSPDWKKTAEVRERTNDPDKMVYCLNEHTGGVRYKLHWVKRQMLIENKLLYSFRLTRANKRAISKAIKEGKEYFVKPRKIKENG